MCIKLLCCTLDIQFCQLYFNKTGKTKQSKDSTVLKKSMEENGAEAVLKAPWCASINPLLAGSGFLEDETGLPELEDYWGLGDTGCLPTSTNRFQYFKNWYRAPRWISWLMVQLLISAQVIILWFVRLSPALGSMLTVQSLLGILSLSLPLPHSFSLSL